MVVLFPSCPGKGKEGREGREGKGTGRGMNGWVKCRREGREGREGKEGKGGSYLPIDILRRGLDVARLAVDAAAPRQLSLAPYIKKKKKKKKGNKNK